ncbi:hypothetical protein RJT34_32338 [Clitoria ternatea]|uniref:Uncharacterized protein n=1 Tax=Clitoria ternatea TaxID=43366 RepID=A0AAN9I272_CLITE
MLLPSDVMPSKRITKEAGIGSTKFLDAYELNSEPEVAAINLGNAKPEVFNSRIAATQYKKLMDEITNYVMEDRVNTVAEDLDRFYQVPSAKNQMVFLCFCIWIIGVLAMFFFTSDIHCPHGGPYLT